MSERFKVFFCEPTGRSVRSMRRYSSSSADCPGMQGMHSYHNAHAPLDIVEHGATRSGDYVPSWVTKNSPEIMARPDWPTKCKACDYVFTPEDEFQVFAVTEYRRADTGELLAKNNLPVGSVIDAWWMERPGPDGRCLAVETPAGQWIIDSRASNCTLKDDDVHRCWVRHGRPEDGTLHIDKNGNTCAAGAGSIDMGGRWHGFLHHGELYRC